MLKRDLLIHPVANGVEEELIANAPTWEGDLPCDSPFTGANHLGASFRGEYRYAIKPTERGARVIEGKVYNHQEEGLIAVFDAKGRTCYTKIKP